MPKSNNGLNLFTSTPVPKSNVSPGEGGPTLRNELNNIEVAYAKFNADKTVSVLEPSAFEVQRFGSLVVTRDRTRPDAYYHRIVGLTSTSLGDLDAALAFLGAAAARVDVTNAVDKFELIAAALNARGFVAGAQMAWLQQTAPDTGNDGAVAADSSDVIALTSADHLFVRAMLEREGAVTDEMWEAKRPFIFAPGMRWWGIAVEHVPVAVASAWTWSGGTSPVSLFGSAGTVAAYRRRGFQRQLLHARLAALVGLCWVDVEAGSISHRNCLRAGFTDSHVQTTFLRA